MSWGDIFGGGIVDSITKLGSEWIETNQEKAEAQAVMIKALDPNGKLRRDITQFACVAYAFYLVSMVFLSLMVAFGVGDSEGAEIAANMMQDLFAPITSAWSLIVGASFGVNGMNSYRGK